MADLTHHERDHHLTAIAAMVAAIGVIIFALCFLAVTIWLVTAQQNAKLYLDDNMVCYSQPFSIECHPRTKP